MRNSKEIIDHWLVTAGDPTLSIYVYYASTAALGTRLGREGFRYALDGLERFCEQLVFEHRGQVHISLLSDHGHSLQACQRFPLTNYLRARGYFPRKKLQGPRDVAIPEFGLITHAAIGTRDPAGVAEEILKHPGSNLAIYPVGKKIVVQSANGLAEIRHRDTRYLYRAVEGDPLHLLPIIEWLEKEEKVDADGFIDDQALLIATADHLYPDPLDRIWRAFHGLAKTAPPLAVTFGNSQCHGWAFFDTMVRMASAHGSLNQSNAAAFVMSTTGPLPPVLRIRNARKHLEKRPDSVTLQSEVGRGLGDSFSADPWSNDRKKPWIFN